MSFEELSVDGIDFEGVEAFGSSTFIAIPTMPVKAPVMDIEVMASGDGTGQSAKVYFEVVEPAEYAGATRNLKMRVVDETQKGQNSRQGWVTALQSVGHTAAKVAQVTSLKGSFFKDKTTGKGRVAHLMNTAGIEGAIDNSKFDSVDWITPESYADRLAAFERAAAHGSNGAGKGGGRARAPAADLDELGGDEPAPATRAKPGPKPVAKAPAGKSARASLLDD